MHLSFINTIKKFKKYLIIAGFCLLIVGITVGTYVLRNNNLDKRGRAAISPGGISTSVAFIGPVNAGYNLKEFANNPSAVTVSTRYQTLQIKLNLAAGVLLNNQSVIRILYPVTGAGVGQYGWTMGQFSSADGKVKYNPQKDKISATSNKGVNFTIKTGDLNQGRVAPIFYIDLQPGDFLFGGDQITLNINDIFTQALPVDNNIFQTFVDELGNNNYVSMGSASFTAFSKPANTAKVFVDSTYQAGSSVKVHVTPAYSGDISLYRYPANDELFDGTITLRQAANSNGVFLWPDGKSSLAQPEYTFTAQRQKNCTRNCSTNILNVTPFGEGFFSLEARVNSNPYDGTFGVSNPTASNGIFFGGTGYPNKKLAIGDWHSHYVDNKSTLNDDINYGKLGFKSDFVGATNKTYYDAYPQNKQSTPEDFQAYLNANDAYNVNGQFLSIPNEEWPKALTYYNPFRSTLESPTVLGDPSANLSFNWIHQMILFKDKSNAQFFSNEDPSNANFYDLIKKLDQQNSVMIPHHSMMYPWMYYDSNTQPDMRVVAFNGYEGGWDNTMGVEKMLSGGAKIGLVGESDSHQGTAAEGGLSGVYLDALNRSALIDSVKKRDTYASLSFGKPLVYFAMTGPVPAEMGKENVLLPGQRPTFKFKVIQSSPIKKVVMWKGVYGGSVEGVDLVSYQNGTVVGINGATCTQIKGTFADCTWTDTSAKDYNYYFINGGNSDYCTRKDIWNFQIYAEHCYWSSPIWISRSNTNYVFADPFNNVADQGREVALKTKFVVNPTSTAADTKNMAIFLANQYPTNGLSLASFGFANSSATDWYKQRTEKTGNAIDFKIRNINGAWQFAGYDYPKFFANQCNGGDNSCVMAFGRPGERNPDGSEKIMYINSNGTYTFNKIQCNGSNLGACSFAGLNLTRSNIVPNRFAVYPADAFDVTWDIVFDPIVKERIYELYTNAASNAGYPQGWRKVGSVLANPTTPSGGIGALTNPDAKGNMKLAANVAFTDDQNGVAGVGNAYFRVNDVDASQPCSFLNEDWYSVDALIKMGSQFNYQLKGNGGQRKVCYYFKDLYGLQSGFASFTVTKPSTTFVTPTPSVAPPVTPTNLQNTCTADGKSCTVSWNSVSGATGYALRIDNQSNAWSNDCNALPGDTCAGVTGTSYTFNATPGATYNWWVHAANSGGMSNAASKIFTAPNPVVPAVPTGLKNTCTADGKSCTVSWNAVSGATAYALRIDDQVNTWNNNCVVQPGDICAGPTATSYTFASTPGAKYVWWVHANNIAGGSDAASSSFVAPIITPTPTKTPTPTPKPTVTVSPVNTVTPTKTPTPTVKPTTTVTPVSTATPTKTPTPTIKPSVSPTKTPTVQPSTSSTPTIIIDCFKKSEGDANCDNSIDLLDFELFRQEFIKFRQGTLDINTAKADFNNDKSVDIADFAIFRDGYLKYKIR